ncbi:MAG: hypothetical protein R3E79_02045 [Caldilineaceae bacterium]
MRTEVRALGADDAAPYQVLRLRSLQEHPEAFGSAYEDEVGRRWRRCRNGCGQPIITSR